MAARAVCSAVRFAELRGTARLLRRRKKVHGGCRDEMDRPLFGQLHDTPAQVGLDRRMPSASSTWFSSISSVTIDFDLTTLVTLCCRAMSSTWRLASAASWRKEPRRHGISSATRTARSACRDWRSSTLIWYAASAPLLEVGNGRRDRRVVLLSRSQVLVRFWNRGDGSDRPLFSSMRKARRRGGQWDWT